MTIWPRAIERIRLIEPPAPPRSQHEGLRVVRTARLRDPVVVHQGKWIKKYVTSATFPGVRYPAVLP